MRRQGFSMIVFDTEDNSAELLAAGKSGFLKRVTQIAALDDKGNRFWNRGDALEFLKWCHQRGGGDVWAFNTQYDIGNLCNKESQLSLDDFDLTLVKGRFIKARLQGLNFYDVRNISGGSVKDLGLAVGLPKFGADYTEKELNKFSAERRVEFIKFGKMSKAELFKNKKYVFRDCEIPMEWLKFVQEKILEMGIEKIPATLGGLCVKAFAVGGGENWHEATEQTSSALIGARVELFCTGGRGRIAYVDMNSLYPYCMTMNFPTGCDKLEKLEGYGIAAAVVNVPKTIRVAPLPWRDDEGRLLFPVGRFNGVWTIHELKRAERAGVKIEKVDWILGSADGKPYYREYILENYRRRLAATSEAENQFYKLLMNNLYGRLAIGGEVSRSLNLTAENKNSGTVYGKKVLATHKMPLPEFSNYLHAAYVLSYARGVLFDYLTQIPADDLIYCDTDSVIFFCKGEIPFPVSKELGAMKLESWGSRCTPILPKTYIFDGKHKAKGVPRRLAEEFIKNKFVEYESPFKIRESINFFEENNSRKLSVWRKVTKDLKAVYDKKRKNKNGIFLPKIINSVKMDLPSQSDFVAAILG